MLSPNELKKGDTIVFNNQPNQIIETIRIFKGRGHTTVQAKVKNLITGAATSETFHPSDSFEEADIKKIKAKFLYAHRGQFFFAKENDPSFRFSLNEEIIGQNSQFLKANSLVETFLFEDRIINICLPIKIQLKVIEAPPNYQGSRAQPGNKTVVLETGAKIDVPLFIKEGDVIEINTETGQYVRRL